MLELLAPAGSRQALQAAVQNGADAVYLGAGSFNARMGARNFSMEELDEAVTYCHIRGVKVHLTVNTLLTDREMPQAARLLTEAACCGVDAFIVQDLGMVALCRQMAPGVPIHASTQMGIHSLEGARQAAELGVRRVIAAREMSEENLRYLCRNSPVEVELFAHGALCMCHSGQCYLSAVVGQRSGNRGRCAQPCRLPYGFGRFEDRYPLSLKDNCLVGHVAELARMGCASLKIEGRMKRPEYVAAATRVYRDAIDGRTPDGEALRRLRDIFSRQGFTDGYFTGRVDGEMFGTRGEERADPAVLAAVRATYESGETPRIPVRFFALIRKNEPAMLAVEDDEGRICKTAGPVPEVAAHRATTEAELRERLTKTGGTPYRVTETKIHLDDGLVLSAAQINGMRRTLLAELTALRGRVAKPELGVYTDVPAIWGKRQAPVFTVRVQSAEQITDSLRQFAPEVLYVPLAELVAHPDCWRNLPEETSVCAVLPRVVYDREAMGVLRQLDAVYAAGVREAMCGNLGHIALARSRGFEVRGDFGFNAFNTRAMYQLHHLGLKSATASFELSLPQLRDLGKPLDTEILVYGRLPLMLVEHCILKERYGSCCCDGTNRLIDRKGAEFFVVRDPGTCRNEILNGKKLYLLDKQENLSGLGLWACRLQFTTESPGQVDQVLRAARSGAPFDAASCTRGLYLRGVE
jgi:putative protease